jgi:hypothetical protein
MPGSAERRDELAVHKKNKRIKRSNLERRNPRLPVARVRTSQPTAAIAMEISEAAIE